MKLFKFLCLVSVLGLASCGNVIKPSRPQLVAEPDKTALMIADSADRATRALESLAAVEQSKNPVAPVAAMVPDAPPELQRAITFSWAGPAEPVAKDIAARAGYSFNTVGDVPPAPIYVTISAYNQPLIEVLRDLGLQMGARADLKLDANARMVEIVYAPTVNHEKPAVKTVARQGRNR